MSYPTYYISSSVTAVDTSTQSKIIMLPPALETLEVRPLMILDRTGNASVSSIYLSTQLNTFMDGGTSTIVMNVDFQCLNLIPYSTTRYAITTNYTQGLSPFLYALQIITEFIDISIENVWSTVAVSPNGQVMLAAASGGGLDGFYVSVNGGSTFSDRIPQSGSFVSSAIGSQYMFVLDSNGYLYKSDDNGSSWIQIGLPEGYTWVSMAINTIGDYIVLITSNLVFWSSNAGQSFNNASFAVGENVTFTGCALGDAPSEAQDDIVVYITAQDLGAGGDYIYVCTNLTEGDPFNQQGPFTNWATVSCNESGSIAYALNSTGELYKSTDTGQTWTYIDLAVTQEPYVNTQIKCSSNGLTLFGISVGGQRYLTDNGATSFSPVGSVIPGILAQYGLSGDGTTSLFALPSVALYRGQTRLA